VTLFSETRLKPHEWIFIPNYKFYRIDRHPGIKGGSAVAVSKGIHHSHADLPTGNSETLLEAVYKCPVHAWSDADIMSS
jgi:hypothetical protein